MNVQYTPPSHRQMRRMLRRLSQRGIKVVNVSIISPDVMIEVGRRVIHITSEGNIRQALRPQRTSLCWRADPQGIAAYHHRMHALYLAIAANARSVRSYSSGRVFADSARLDRLYGSAF